MSPELMKVRRIECVLIDSASAAVTVGLPKMSIGSDLILAVAGLIVYFRAEQDG